MSRMIILVLLLFPSLSQAIKSPHYNEVGFFDIHVCNWPDQPLFFLTLFSTYHYKDVAKLEVFDAKEKLIGSLNLNKFRVMKTPKGEKRAFLNHMAIPEKSPDGWYRMKITLNDGSKYVAKDYVIINKLPQAAGLNPKDRSEDVEIPEKLTWEPVPGAKYYQIFIRDFWNDEKIIHTSKLLDKPEFTIPKGLLEDGGWYGWRVHARDTNEHVLLGDFNHGSLTKEIRFTTAQ